MPSPLDEILDKTSLPWNGATCAVIGSDGFDTCVALNLLLTYTKLGFKTFLSNNLVPADLVVIIRYGDSLPNEWEEASKKIPPKTPIHIYPYVGYHADFLVPFLSQCPITVFAPSRQLFVENSGWDNRLALTPVWTKFWSRPVKERQYKFVHVGNCKSRGIPEASWPEEQELISSLRRADTHLWGTHGWDLISGIANWHGAIPVVSLSDLYSVADFALGLMYPFQFEAGTYSSRYWQAPLCGTRLIIEKKSKARFPGVYALGTSNLDEAVTLISETAEEVQRKAVEFWNIECTATVSQILNSLETNPPHNECFYPNQYTVSSASVLWKGDIAEKRIYVPDRLP